MKNRLFSVLLAVLMIVSLLPTMAFASEVGCTHTQKVTTIVNGETYQMNLSGKNKGDFTFEASGKNWNIKNSDGKYLNAETGKLVLGDNAQTAWTYSKGAFSISEKTTQKNNGYWWGWMWNPGWGSKTVTTTYYLSTVTSGKLSTGYVGAELFKTVSSEHDYGNAVNVDNTNHKYVCKNCGDEKVEAHSYDPETHKCICGAYDPAESSVKISVDVKEKTSKQFVGWWFWGTWKDVTTYTATIKTEAKGVKVTKVQYQLNGGRWTDGTCVSSDKPIESLKVKAWDNKGNLYEYAWPEEPAPILTPVDAPEAATGLIYNGQEQTGVAEATGYTVTNGKATDASSYTATATLAEGYKWSDDTTVAKQIDWSIAKAALTATADDKTVTVGDEAPAYTITYTGWVNGESIETVTPTTLAALSCAYTTSSPAGDYDITFTTAPVFANYDVTTVKGKLTAKTWGVIGGFSDWADVPMTEKESNVFVSPAIELTTSDQFKVRYGGDWDKDYGASWDTELYVITSGVAVEAVEGGCNLAVPTDGAYTVTLNLNNSTITVTEVVVPVTGVTLEPAEITLTVGDDDGKLTATVAPENATNKSVTWSSSKTDVATVDNEGNVHAKAAGTATITVTTVDGNKTSTCEVTVVAPVPATTIETVADVLATNPDFPTTVTSAWTNTNGEKCYLNGESLVVASRSYSIDSLSIEKSGENYISETEDGTITFNMINGVLTCITAKGLGEGIYAPAGTAFKAVYNTTDEANTLTFYYDNKDHSKEGTVYADLPVAAAKQADWGYNSNRASIKSVIIDESVKNYHGLTSTKFMFQGMQNVGNISGTGNLNTSKVTDMTGMFYGCKVLTSLNLSNFDTSNVTNMQSMFGNCNELSSLDLSNSFDTSKVTSMQSMFLSCKKLETLDLSKFSTTSATTMNSMFKDCSSLKTIKFGNNFNTSNVTNMGDMFLNCTKLQLLGLSSFNTSKVTIMTDMFQNCETLTTLDLSSFDTSKVTIMNNMFKGCGSLETIGLDGFTVGNETTVVDMFSGCSKLTSVKIISDENGKIRNALGEDWTYNGETKAYEKQPAAPLKSALLMSMPAVEDVLLEDTQEMETVSELSEIAEVEQAEEIETIDETVEVVTTSLESIAGITDLNDIHWLGDAEGKECYISGSKLVFSNSSGTDEIGLNTLLTQCGSDWKLEKDSVIVTFVMKNGKLDRIIYEGDGRFNAVYFAPAVEEVTEESEPITEEPVEEIVEEAIEETTEETVTEESIVETKSDGEESVPESKPEESEGIPKEQTLPVVIEEKSVEITIVEEVEPKEE